VDGFVCGGVNSTAATESTSKFDFAVAAAATTAANSLNGALKQVSCGIQSITDDEGYVCGGANNAGTRTDRIDRFPMSGTPTAATIVVTLAAAKQQFSSSGASSDVNAFGFIMGGNDVGADTDVIERLTFTTGSPSINNAYGTLTSAINRGAAVSGDNDAFYEGGLIPGNTTRIDMFDYVTFAGVSSGGTLSVARNQGSGIGGT